MVALTDYWYYGQVERIMLHTARFFCNLQISVGKDEDGEDILKRVPLNTAFNDKTVASLMSGASDTFMQVAPRMILQLTGVSMNNERTMGPAYKDVHTTMTERAWNEEAGNYYDGREHGMGDSYEITRLNPVPLGLTFKLHILTTLYSQKFQLFEQIRPLFSPTAEIQVSENPLDWDRYAQITMTDIEFSNKLNNNNSNELDDMVLTFKVDTNLDMPAEIMLTRNEIQQVNVQLNNLANELGWDFELGNTQIFTPTECSVKVIGNNKVQLLDPYGIKSTKTWKDIYDIYKLSIKATNIHMSLLQNKDIKNRAGDVSGLVMVDNENPVYLNIILDNDTLPSPTVDNVNDIIDPLAQFPENGLPEAEEGQRYLIVSDVSSNTTAWGIIKDESGNTTHAKENQIIEYRNGFWTIVYNPEDVNGRSIVRCMADDIITNLYVYDSKQKTWLDLINKLYKSGYFRIWVA